MNVLYLTTRFCWPPRSGSHLRDFHLARQIATWATLTYVGLDAEGLSPGEDSRRERLAALHDSEVIRIRREPGYSRLNLMRGLLGPKPISILNYTTPAMMSVVEQLLRERSFDAVQVESVHFIAYAERIRQLAPNVPILCDWHNIESEILRRYAENCTSLPRRIYALRTAKLLRRFERKFLLLGDANTVCSERERQVLLGLEPTANIEVIENGLDFEYLSQPDSTPAGQRRNLVYVGLMEYHANVDAVSYFAKEVWPTVRQRRPELQFVIVGARPTAEVRALGKLPGITVTGTVDDLRPYYWDALAAVVPLRVGGGTRLKIVEAMAAGVPVISSTIGAEGLPVTSGEELLLADTPSEIADAVTGLYADSAEWHRLSQNAKRLVMSRYNWPVVGEKLLRVYSERLRVVPVVSTAPDFGTSRSNGRA